MDGDVDNSKQTVKEEDDTALQTMEKEDQACSPINNSSEMADNLAQPSIDECASYPIFRPQIFSEMIGSSSSSDSKESDDDKSMEVGDECIPEKKILSHEKYESYLENIDPEDLCDCEHCLTIWKKHPKSVLKSYGVNVNDENGDNSSSEDEEDFEMNDDESYYDDSDNENFVYDLESDSDNNGNNCEDSKNLSQNTASLGNVAHKGNNVKTEKSTKQSLYGSENSFNFNSTSSLDNLDENNDVTRIIKSSIIESVVLGLSQKQSKSQEPPITHTFQPTSNIITQRKFEQSVISQMIVTVSLACKVETCPLLFLDKSQLELHMFSVHGVYPYKCWAGCLDKTFPNKKNLVEHTKAEHSDHKTWKCDLCKNRVFSKYQTLYSHITKEHEAGVFKCSWSEHQMTFRFRQEVFDHILQTHNIKFSKTVWKREPLPGSSNEKEKDNDDDDDDDEDDDDEDDQELQSQFLNNQSSLQGSLSHEMASSSYSDHLSKVSPDDERLNAGKRWINSVPTSQKHLFQYQCTWPGCGRTSGVIWNMRRHIRTVHFKLPKTKHEMQNEDINITEIDRKESQYIHIFAL